MACAIYAKTEAQGCHVCNTAQRCGAVVLHVTLELGLTVDKALASATRVACAMFIMRNPKP